MTPSTVRTLKVFLLRLLFLAIVVAAVCAGVRDPRVQPSHQGAGGVEADDLSDEPRCQIPKGFKVSQPSRRSELCCDNPLKRCVNPFVWSCQCGACAKVAGAFAISNLEVRHFSQKQGCLNRLLTGANVKSTESMKTYADLDSIADGNMSGDGRFFPDREYVLFLLPMSDHNGAFGIGSQVCARIDCWKSRGKIVVVRYVRSTRQARDILNMFRERSLYHVTLGGHGSSTLLQWGERSAVRSTDCCLAVNSENTNEFLHLLKRKLHVHGGVTLDSCSNAKGRWMGKNFFKYVASKMTGVRVIASQTILTDEMWKAPKTDCLADDSVRFYKDEKDVTAIANGGMPKCKDLAPNELTALAEDHGVCLTGCHTSCDDIAKLHKGLIFELQTDVGLGNSSWVSSCGIGFSRKVCRVSANDEFWAVRSSNRTLKADRVCEQES
eukprot:TRINITY_DN29478_c0_g1_i1.p1 TRINITY_DN29478_c0_g1~~TRINITY_DN29478_c0_g1_i1.p1  ORF type:complete len:438 (+),score=22.96 TRINITY_DN29478_c0_g1_i1:102-1415(+)